MVPREPLQNVTARQAGKQVGKLIGDMDHEIKIISGYNRSWIIELTIRCCWLFFFSRTRRLRLTFQPEPVWVPPASPIDSWGNRLEPVLPERPMHLTQPFPYTIHEATTGGEFALIERSCNLQGILEGLRRKYL